MSVLCDMMERKAFVPCTSGNGSSHWLMTAGEAVIALCQSSAHTRIRIISHLWEHPSPVLWRLRGVSTSGATHFLCFNVSWTLTAHIPPQGPGPDKKSLTRLLAKYMNKYQVFYKQDTKLHRETWAQVTLAPYMSWCVYPFLPKTQCLWREDCWPGLEWTGWCAQ